MMFYLANCGHILYDNLFKKNSAISKTDGNLISKIENKENFKNIESNLEVLAILNINFFKSNLQKEIVWTKIY